MDEAETSVGTFNAGIALAVPTAATCTRRILVAQVLVAVAETEAMTVTEALTESESETETETETETEAVTAPVIVIEIMTGTLEGGIMIEIVEGIDERPLKIFY